MPVFAYRAVDASWVSVRGTVTAETPRQARDELRGRGLAVEQLSAPRSGGTFRFWQRRGRFEARLVPIIRELATLLSAAIPLDSALDTIARQQRGAFGAALAQLRDKVSAGTSLAEAMREQSAVFDSLTIHMVEVGENAGNLDVVLDQLAEFRERYVHFKDRVITALFYPLVVLGMGLCVSLFLMTFVVPMLLDNLLEAGQTIPLPTRILKAGSDVLRGHGFWLVAAGATLFVGWIAALRTARGRKLWHTALLKSPLIGTLVRKQEIARASLILSTLMESGIVFLHALEIATRAVKNVVLRECFAAIHDQVKAGRDIGEAMERTTGFPALVVQIFTVGQQTGKLEAMLARLAADYERQVSSLSLRLATIMEPVLIVLLALFVGFILFATMLPILEAGNVL